MDQTITNKTTGNFRGKDKKKLCGNSHEETMGKYLKSLKITTEEPFGNEIDFITKTTDLGILGFKTRHTLTTPKNIDPLVAILTCKTSNKPCKIQRTTISLS